MCKTEKPSIRYLNPLFKPFQLSYSIYITWITCSAD